MSSKIELKLSALSGDALLEQLDALVQQLQQHFGDETIDELLYKLVAQSMKRIYQNAAAPNNDSTEQYSFELSHMSLDAVAPQLDTMFAHIERQVGNTTAERIMYQLMYRLGVRIGKYDECGEDSDDDDDSDIEDMLLGRHQNMGDMMFATDHLDPYELVLLTSAQDAREHKRIAQMRERQMKVVLTAEKKLTAAPQTVESASTQSGSSVPCNFKCSDEINRENEERELLAKC